MERRDNSWDVTLSVRKLRKGLLCRSGDGNVDYAIDFSASPVACSQIVNNDGILVEILSRLPVKSLLRFKSVCKHWLSLIKNDTYLIELHHTRSKSRPHLLVIVPLKEQVKNSDGHWIGRTKTPHQCILSAELLLGEGSGYEEREPEPEAIVYNVRMTDPNWFVYDEVLGPVNGLVCFIDYKAFAVRMYNISTREVSPWIKSTLLEEERDKFEKEYGGSIKIVPRGAIFRLGFDPLAKEHKVFCFWELRGIQTILGCVSESHKYVSWEALTVGRDTKWRRIGVVPHEDNQLKVNVLFPPYSRGKTSVYANGSIYWRNKLMSTSCDSVNRIDNKYFFEDDEPDVIVAFDVGSEKFRVIPIPKFILDEPRELHFLQPIAILEMDGLVVLVYRKRPCTVKLWILNDDVDKKVENCRGSMRNWTEETIALPFLCDTRILGFHGIPGTTQIVFENYGDFHKHIKLVSLYSYDLKKKTFKEIEISGISSIPLHYTRFLFETFTESLFPLQPQQQQCT